MNVTILITSFNDRRIEKTLESLRNQTKKPDEILIADGGTEWDIKSIAEKYGARLEILPGNVVETRQKALNIINSDIIAFIDTDEIAPETWLEKITAPILDGKADFTGGPTKHYEPKTGAEEYVNELEDFIYKYQVPNNIGFLPMGNSAWKKKIFDDIRGFDLNISGGSEDYDVNLRALSKGYKGKFVEDAWVYHDHSDINSYRKLIKKRYSYLRATAKTYIKNKSLTKRIRTKTGGRIKHPFHYIEDVMKPIALIDALIRK
jgi:glycosyltransferase involved in cell wall biosynthesis